jgi:hypothetical protein
VNSRQRAGAGAREHAWCLSAAGLYTLFFNFYYYFCLMFFFFSSGAFLSAVVFPQIGFKAFYIALAISTLMTVMSFYTRKTEIMSGSKSLG